jgi:hypothetical protein
MDLPLGDRVNSSGMQGMALAQAFCTQKEAFDHAVFFDCLVGVVGTGGMEAAVIA